MDDDELDLGEAAAFILGERPSLGEDDVWTILKELQDPPVRNADGMAVDLPWGSLLLIAAGQAAAREPLLALGSAVSRCIDEARPAGKRPARRAQPDPVGERGRDLLRRRIDRGGRHRLAASAPPWAGLVAEIIEERQLRRSHAGSRKGRGTTWLGRPLLAA